PLILYLPIGSPCIRWYGLPATCTILTYVSFLFYMKVDWFAPLRVKILFLKNKTNVCLST
ncbi:hypothetical protein, partial [Bacillus haikouensis]|uniref:hypothetical protein n=1 Tax=Bacillus haikouensis TaxID=1510468 RepID=UPI001C131237